MIEKEEYFRQVIKNTIKAMGNQLLQGRELIKKYDTRTDQKQIDKEIDKISTEIADKFIIRLKEDGFLKGDKEISEKEFTKLLDLIVKEYLGGSDEKPSNGKDKNNPK